MPLPASGAISLNDLQNEFGGSNPIAITEYYRVPNGLVPDIPANSSVPTSGQISLSNFYNTTAADLIPNAVDWSNIAASDDGSGDGFSIYAENTNQTISGINAPITLRISVPSFEVNYTGSSGSCTESLDIIKNGSVVATLSKTRNAPTGSNTSDANTTISVASGDTLRFAAYAILSGVNNTSGGGGGTVSIINQSSSNTVLDTFIFTTSAIRDDGQLEAPE
jgi:hypothetical protein